MFQIGPGQFLKPSLPDRPALICGRIGSYTADSPWFRAFKKHLAIPSSCGLLFVIWNVQGGNTATQAILDTDKTGRILNPYCGKEWKMLYSEAEEQPCYRVALAFILHRMEVVSMKHFDFRDLMSFGMFTWYVTKLNIEKPPSNFDQGTGWNFYPCIKANPPCGRLFLFYVLIIAYQRKKFNRYIHPQQNQLRPNTRKCNQTIRNQ